eukprot:Nk52_evm54s621 gene=Nk52_evmTU54s621
MQPYICLIKRRSNLFPKWFGLACNQRATCCTPISAGETPTDARQIFSLQQQQQDKRRKTKKKKNPEEERFLYRDSGYSSQRRGLRERGGEEVKADGNFPSVRGIHSSAVVSNSDKDDNNNNNNNNNDNNDKNSNSEGRLSRWRPKGFLGKGSFILGRGGGGDSSSLTKGGMEDEEDVPGNEGRSTIMKMMISGRSTSLGGKRRGGGGRGERGEEEDGRVEQGIYVQSENRLNVRDPANKLVDVYEVILPSVTDLRPASPIRAESSFLFTDSLRGMTSALRAESVNAPLLKHWQSIQTAINGCSGEEFYFPSMDVLPLELGPVLISELMYRYDVYGEYGAVAYDEATERRKRRNDFLVGLDELDSQRQKDRMRKIDGQRSQPEDEKEDNDASTSSSTSNTSRGTLGGVNIVLEGAVFDRVQMQLDAVIVELAKVVSKGSFAEVEESKTSQIKALLDHFGRNLHFRQLSPGLNEKLSSIDYVLGEKIGSSAAITLVFMTLMQRMGIPLYGLGINGQILCGFTEDKATNFGLMTELDHFVDFSLNGCLPRKEMKQLLDSRGEKFTDADLRPISIISVYRKLVLDTMYTLMRKECFSKQARFLEVLEILDEAKSLQGYWMLLRAQALMNASMAENWQAPRSSPRSNQPKGSIKSGLEMFIVTLSYLHEALDVLEKLHGLPEDKRQYPSHRRGVGMSSSPHDTRDSNEVDVDEYVGPTACSIPLHAVESLYEIAFSRSNDLVNNRA